MSRPLRINREDGWYHVYSRGVNRQAVFDDERDRNHFLELIEKTVERHRVIVHGYVLMRNHYHLIVQTPDANLSRAIQWLNQSYAGWYLARPNRTGQVFQRPFGSRMIEDGSWALEVSEYLHLNPLRIAAFSLSSRDRKAANAGLWKEPSREQVVARLKKLRTYKWSSYRSYAGYAQGPKWLRTQDLLKRVPGNSVDEKIRRYRRRIRDRLKEGVDAGEMERLRDRLCVGTDRFVKQTRKLLARRGVGRELSGKRTVRRRLEVSDVIDAVSAAKGEDWEEYADRHGDHGKSVVMLLARNYTGLTLGDIGEALGGKDYGAVCMAIRRFEKKTETDRNARRLLAKAENMLDVRM